MIMKPDKNEVISAQVILLPASGKKFGSDNLVTAENIAEFSPPPDAYPTASKVFSSKDFEIGPLVGPTFSITAPVSKFETLFKTDFQRRENGAIECVGGGLEIRLNHLPDNARKIIQTVTFTEPPDFGPTEF